MLDPDGIHHAALVDPEEQLLLIDRVRQAVQPLHLLAAPDQPTGGTVHTAADIVIVRMAGGTLVKGHGDGRSQIRLDLHALLRSHEDLMSVDMGLEGDAFLSDLPEACQGEHLEAAGVREDRPVPVHELVEPAKSLDQLIPCPHMEMVGIGQLHLGADRLQIICGDGALDGGHRPHVHEQRGLDSAVDCCKLRPLGPSVRC